MLRVAQMELMKEMGFGGGSMILPLLVQMPFFIALNRVLSSAIELYHAPFIFWISDLSRPDAILPWILGITMLCSMLLASVRGGKKKMQPVQLLVSLVMVLIFMGVAFKLSAGLILFIIVGALFRIFQGFILQRIYA
jgi:YidC/Oxa1 family membrane protein insertase